MSEIYVAQVRAFESEAHKADCDLTRREDDQTYASYPTRFAWQLWQDRDQLRIDGPIVESSRRSSWLAVLCVFLVSVALGMWICEQIGVPPALHVTFAPPRPPDPIFAPQCLQTVMEMAHCDLGRFVCMHVTAPPTTPPQKQILPPRLVPRGARVRLGCPLGGKGLVIE